MNIRDLQFKNDQTDLEELVIHGVEPLLHFSDLLREDLEGDYQPGDTVMKRRLFFVEEMIQRLKDMRDCLLRFEAEERALSRYKML